MKAAGQDGSTGPRVARVTPGRNEDAAGDRLAGAHPAPVDPGRGDVRALLALYAELDDAQRQELLQFALRLRRGGLS